MRRILFIGLAVLCFTTVAFAQGYVFGPNIRISDYPPGTSYAYTPNAGQRGVAVRGDTVYCAWDDSRTGGWGVWFCKSTDGGQTFSPNVQVDDGLGEAYRSTISVGDDGTIYVAWYGEPSPFNYIQVFFSKSTDGGLTFTPDVIVNDTAGGVKNRPHGNPSMGVDSAGVIYVAFDDGRNGPGNYDIYFSKSTDGGATFLLDVLVNDTIGDTLNDILPALSMSNDGIIYISWSEFYKWLYVSKSTDGGMSFGTEVLVNDTITESWRNTMDVDSRGYLHLAWRDDRDGNANIYYSQSRDSGLTFSPNIRLNDSLHEALPQSNPSLCVDDSDIVYAVWQDGGLSNSDIYFTLSTDAEDTAFVEPNVAVDNTDSTCWAPSMAVGDSGKVYVMWKDFRYAFFNCDVFLSVGKYETGIEEGISKNEEGVKHKISLCPNPFSRTSIIKYTITQKRTLVNLSIYDLSGRLIKQLVNREKDSGVYTTIWQGDDENGETVPSGVYFIKGEIGVNNINKKVVKINYTK